MHTSLSPYIHTYLFFFSLAYLLSVCVWLRLTVKWFCVFYVFLVFLFFLKLLNSNYKEEDGQRMVGESGEANTKIALGFTCDVGTFLKCMICRWVASPYRKLFGSPTPDIGHRALGCLALAQSWIGWCYFHEGLQFTKLSFWVGDNGLGSVGNGTQVGRQGETAGLEHFPTYKFWPLPSFSLDSMDTWGDKGWCWPSSSLLLTRLWGQALMVSVQSAESLLPQVRKKGKLTVRTLCYKWPRALRVRFPAGPAAMGGGGSGNQRQDIQCGGEKRLREGSEVNIVLFY